MSDSTKTVERLQELLDAKDEEIDGLREERDNLKRIVNDDPFSWAFLDKPSGRDLPVPRLEIEWTPDEEWGWSKATAIYRLVWRHFLGDIVSTGLSRTVRTSGIGAHGQPPINPRTFTHRPGKIELPRRDGAHICHDMAQLKLPGFAICGEHVDDLSDLAGKPENR